MKITFLIVTTMIIIALNTFAATAAPRQGGGYVYTSSTGRPAGYAVPRQGGGYNYYSATGTSTGQTVPRQGGGYHYYPAPKSSR